MKRLNFFFLTFFFITMPAVYGQTKHNYKKFDIDSFNKQKASFIITEAELTTSQADQFIPLLNELQQKRFELNRQVRSQSRKLKKNSNVTDNDYQQFNELSLDSSLKEAQLNKEYYQKFKMILSPRQIYKYQLAESVFMRNFIDKHRQERKKKK